MRPFQEIGYAILAGTALRVDYSSKLAQDSWHTELAKWSAVQKALKTSRHSVTSKRWYGKKEILKKMQQIEVVKL